MTVEPRALDDAPLLAVEPGYKNVLRIRLLAFWAPLVVAALLLDGIALEGTPWLGLPSVGVPLLGLISLTLAPERIYRRLRYAIDGRLLRVVRGWLFHTDTIVPFVRVQHIDVTRGPFDKMFGTSTLVVHTAGTHNSTVMVPGLAPDRAAEIRDTIREHVRTDFA
jgi:membrane protein YdbS with pleckstrin-like domain